MAGSKFSYFSRKILRSENFFDRIEPRSQLSCQYHYDKLNIVHPSFFENNTGWVDGLVEVKALLKIACSNQNPSFIDTQT
jgi:hypothetical protein